MTPEVLEAIRELRDVNRLSWKEIEAKIGFEQSWCRQVYSGRATAKPAKQRPCKKPDWYALAAEVVLTTAESIDSVCERLELNPKTLVRRMYG